MKNIIFTLLVLTSCSTPVQLTPAGENVIVVTKVESHCASLGLVSGTSKDASATDEVLRSDALHALKNNAAKKGATHVIITSKFLRNKLTYDGEAYLCTTPPLKPLKY